MWGIGSASEKKLQALGLANVADLAAFDVTQGREVLTVTGARVIMELQGECCLPPLSLISPQRKGLAVIRTFGEYVTEWEELKKSVSTFASRAGEKLREHGLLACAMTVFIQTNRFKPEAFYSNAATFGLEPTQNTFALIRDALRGTRSIFRPGYRYWKAKRISCFGISYLDADYPRLRPESPGPEIKQRPSAEFLTLLAYHWLVIAVRLFRWQRQNRVKLMHAKNYIAVCSKLNGPAYPRLFQEGTDGLSPASFGARPWRGRDA